MLHDAQAAGRVVLAVEQAVLVGGRAVFAAELIVSAEERVAKELTDDDGSVELDSALLQFVQVVSFDGDGVVELSVEARCAASDSEHFAA